jgi:Tfp pilus assembly protein PilN
MEDKIVKIQGTNPLVRDLSNNAVINSDRLALQEAKAKKAQRLQDKNRIEKLENEISDIKNMMHQILQKLDK